MHIELLHWRVYFFAPVLPIFNPATAHAKTAVQNSVYFLPRRKKYFVIERNEGIIAEMWGMIQST